MSLTKSDITQIKGLLNDQEHKFETKIVEVKNDFYNKIDPILKEVTSNREELPIISHRLSNHEDRIEKVEKKLSIQPAI
jgi:hypothetical protein